MSLSARRAWIEIIDYIIDYVTDAIVALRKESVDRNSIALVSFRAYIVALRKESVDRNDAVQIIVVVMYASLSARRAWIEITRQTYQQGEKRGRSPQGERG